MALTAEAEMGRRAFPNPWGICICPGNTKLSSQGSVLDGLTEADFWFQSHEGGWFVQGSLHNTDLGSAFLQLYHQNT